MVTLVKRKTVAVELSAATEDSPAVVVFARPVGQADIDLALGAVTASIVKASDGAEALTRYGFDLAGDAREVMQAAARVGNAMLAIELGLRHIERWEGVGLSDDAPAPVEPATVALLFNEWAPASDGDPVESYGSRFMRRINGLSLLEPGAKKGSGASPDGNTGAAPPTAPVAVN